MPGKWHRDRPVLATIAPAAFILMMSVFAAHAQPARAKIYFHSGTGFFVNRDGYVLTNEHILKDCKRITISGTVTNQSVKLVAVDAVHDLALLKAPGSPDYSIAEFRALSQPVQKDERVVVIGYPGEAANKGQTVMRRGVVQNTKGPSEKPHWMEISDILEKGNSGGPVMDKTGNVIGVAVAMMQMSLQTVVNGVTEESRTWESGAAITTLPVRNFLKTQGVSYYESPSGALLSDSQLNELAHRFIVNVRCEYKVVMLD